MKPRVALLLGSDSDLERMRPAVDLLREFGLSPIVRILSAHRTPEETARFTAGAREEGFQVLLAAAGGAAHLAGAVAARTTLPVIGIPLDNPPLGGLDALLATVQMPGGVPVATVGLGRGGPRNAALLALRILALSDASLGKRLEAFGKEQHDRVLEKDRRLSEDGRP